MNVLNWISDLKIPAMGNFSQLPSVNRMVKWLLAMVKTFGLEWSYLTRPRTLDVVVGLTVHCLLVAVYVILATCLRVAQTTLLVLYTTALRLATMLGIVKPVRLVRDTGNVREQLEGATLMKGAGFNLVLFEDLER